MAALSLWICGLPLGLSGCAASSVILVGPVRPSLAPSAVRLYLKPPDTSYVEIAELRASSRGSFAFGSGAKIDKVVERLRAAAAKVGANGLLLHGVGTGSSGAVSGTVSTDTGHSPYVDALGASLVFHPELGDGVAIYVEDH
jgi:hypothetical protein